MEDSKVKYLKISEIANLFEVSQATVRNWQKTNIIPCHIAIEEIETIKGNLKSRNNKRANKNSNSNYTVPLNYLDNNLNESRVMDVCEELVSLEFNVRQKVYLLVLLLLRQKNEVDNALCFKRDVIGKICDDFSKDIDRDSVISYFLTSDIILPNDESDVLGVLYQSIKTVGNKSKSGSFYTPPVLSKKIIEDDNVGDTNVLDPCCGTGSFLIKLSEKYSFDNIYAIDNDDIAVFIAKINLLLSFPETNANPNVYHADSLNSDVDISGVEYICSNPPWGAFKNSDAYKSYRKLVGSSEIFSMFLYKFMNALEKGGRLSFILPESFLNVSLHSKIRSYLCNNFTINRIEFLGRIFSDVFTPVILISIDKISPRDNHKVIIRKDSCEFEIEQSGYINNIDCVFDAISPDSKDGIILNKIYSVDYHVLKDNAEWILGIVTGNNSSHLRTDGAKGYEPIITGKEVDKMKLNSPGHYIKFDKSKYHQSLDECSYKVKEKLVYKFISSNIVVAYDDSRSFTLNSANAVVPNIKDYSMKLVCAILNSDVCNFVFKKKFNTFKVLKRHLEMLPIVKLSLHQIEELESIINDYYDNKCDYDSINDYISNVYALTEEERAYMRYSRDI